MYDIKQIIKNIAFIVLFNIWMLFLWISDIIVFERVLKTEYYIMVWPTAIVIHIITIVGWFVLSRCKRINRNIFICFTFLFALILILFGTLVITDKRFEFGLNEYLDFFIASIVPAFIVIISIIIYFLSKYM